MSHRFPRLARSRSHETRDVLVVDDSPTNRHVIAARLARLGFRVALCASGGEALAQIAARRFDLVLLDAAMPGLSGLETLARLRTLAYGNVPVMMMTARDDFAAARQALAAGADDHVARPFVFEALAARIERLMARVPGIAELSRANAALAGQLARVSAGTSAP